MAGLSCPGAGGCKSAILRGFPDVFSFFGPCMVGAISFTGCPVCLVLRQGAVNQLFLEVFLMFLACLDHAWWAKFHLGILGPQK